MAVPCAPPACELGHTMRPGTSLRRHRLQALSGQLEVDARRSDATSALLNLGTGRIMKNKRLLLPSIACQPGEQDACTRSMPSSLPVLLQAANTEEGQVHPLISYRKIAEPVRSASTPSASAGQPSPRKKSNEAALRKANTLHHVETLEESFDLHVKLIAGAGDRFGVNELVRFCEQCGLFDQWLAERRVRLFWTSYFEGNPEADPNQVTYQEFEGFLQWSADVKGWSWTAMTEKIILFFQQHSDKSAALLWRLEVVFETFAKSQAESLTAVEFVALCTACGLCERPRFSIADIYLLFAERGVTSVDFKQYLEMLSLAGKKLGIGDQALRRIADAADTLDSEPFVIMRVRLALKTAASTAQGIDWYKMFYEVDQDQDGTVSWEEFRNLVRERMELVNVSDWGLRMLFRKVDSDGCGRVSLQELVEFIADGVEHT